MASKGDERIIAAYDSTLLGMLQNEGGLESFLDVIFGFLSRRTDFYITMTSKTQKYGFPEGVAKKMILHYFNKYHSMVQKAMMQQKATDASKPVNSASSILDVENGHEAHVANEVVNTLATKLKGDESGHDELREDKPKDVELESKHPEQDSASTAETSSIKQDAKDPNLAKVLDAKSDEDIQVVFQSNPDSYNGAIRDKYSWSQNYDDVDVKIPVSEGIKSARQVSISIERKHLKVLIKSDDDPFETIIDNKLQHEINREESMWSLEGGRHIDITLTKDKNIWWSKLLDEEKEIDVQKICPERSMADMDEEEKAVINKLQFDDHQKKLGLPQSHELKVHEMLKKGWDAEGSPFKGQDFDPSMFNISPSAIDT